MKKVRLIICLSFIFLLTGCWNYNELNNLAIITGVAIDKKNNEYVMTYMIANSSQGDSKSNSNQASTVLYEGKGDTLTKASENINQKLPKTPYLGHNEVVIISEEVAKTNMVDTMDFFLRNPESRKEIYVLISKGVDAKDTLSILTPLESFPSNNIKSNIEAAENEIASTYTIKYSQFLAQLIEEGIDPVLGVIEVEGNVKEGQSQESNDKSKQDAVIKLVDSAVFNKDKLVYITNEQESSSINTLNNNFNNIYIETKCENKKIVTNITSIKVKTNVEVNNNKVKVLISASGIGSLIEVNCKKDLENTKVIEEIKKDVDREMKNFLYNGINVAKTYKTDIFGFGKMLYKKNPKYWNSIKNNWNEEILPELDVEIKTDIQLENKGSLQQTIKGEIK